MLYDETDNLEADGYQLWREQSSLKVSITSFRKSPEADVEKVHLEETLWYSMHVTQYTLHAFLFEMNEIGRIDDP